MTGLPPGTRVAVAGHATAEEALAVLLALDQARAADAPPAPASPPAWMRAARQEGVGGRMAASPADLGRWRR